MQVTGDISAHANVTSTRTLAQNAATSPAPPVAEDQDTEESKVIPPTAKPGRLDVYA